MIIPSLYPWHQSAWQQLLAYKNQRGLPHAILLQGQTGLAKMSFAERVIPYLLCEKPVFNEHTWLTCNHCFACQLSDLREHPDYFILQPAEEGKAIKIEQIRELIDALQQTSHRSGNRVIIINPAESMNLAAVNALLKTLEEPGLHCYFWLITAAAAQLPATIRSRCQSIKINPVFDEASITWLSQEIKSDKSTAAALLQRAEGSPQQALALMNIDDKQTQAQLLQELTTLLTKENSLINIAQSWQKRGFLVFLDQLISLLNQVLQQRLRDKELNLLMELSIHQLTEKISFLLQVRKEWIINPHLNAQLLSEKIALYLKS